jgi:glycosyltransferase involved in cell wall biosynthesis
MVRAPAADVVHVHGLWLMPNVYAGRAASRARRPLVVSPRGMLSPEALRFSRSKKRLFWALLQEPAYRDAACWHATSDQEMEDLRAFGVRAPVAVIPNGVDLPTTVSARTDREHRTVMSLGRIHPKKGLDKLIRAWAAVGPSAPDWCLRIVGPDEGGHADELVRLAHAVGAPNVCVEGPVYGAAKWDVLRAADLFVLPTLSENFGLAVAEALAAGLPAIVTKGAPWAGLETEHCGWWIDHGVEPLEIALRGAISMPAAELRAMGERGRAWIAREFSWDRVAADMVAVYRWLKEGGIPPGIVRLD